MSLDMENSRELEKPISTVRYGLGKEIRLYLDELSITADGKETRLPLAEIKRLTLMPGDPTPSKLILMADLEDDTNVVLAEGMSNARDFRAMLPHLIELCPNLQLDPPDMSDQLWQALNNRRAWNITCYGAIILILVFLYVLYLVVTFIGSHH
jgi:hypothetical protein